MENLSRKDATTQSDIRLLKESRFGTRYATVAPMLKRWRIRNFKSIKSAEIELAPLTVLVGANSAGKSSLLQSILLMAQNASQDTENVSLSSRGGIFFNGQLVELGSIEECLHRKQFTSEEWNQRAITRDTEQIESNIDQIGFGADFSFGKNYFKNKGSFLSGRNLPDEIKWDLSLLSNNEDLEGIGQVSSAKLELSQQGEFIEVLGGIIAQFTKSVGSDNTVLDNPAFNRGYETSLWENKSYQIFSKRREVPQRLDEHFDAISFSAGLPCKGLIEQSRIDALLDLLSSEWFGAMEKVGFKGPYASSFETMVLKYLEYEKNGNLIPFDKSQLMTIPQATDQAVTNLISILEEDSSSDSDGLEVSNRHRQLRNKLREMIDFTNINWETFEAELASNNNDLEEMSAFLDGTRGYDKDYLANKDDQLRSEMAVFMENLSIRAKTELASSKSAQEKVYVDPTERFSRGTGSVGIPGTGKRVFNHVEFWNEYLNTKVKYIGPIREEAKAFYPYASSSTISNQMPIGPKGEYLAQILYDSTLRPFPLPGHLKNTKKISLKDAVNKWIPVLGLIGEVDVSPRGRQGIHLSYGHDVLPMVGTGVSQVLPVLVLCLTSNPGDLILLEQPELHLNPSIQQKLAEFFLAMSKTGRQLIVETHSEYLVTRLRLAGLKDDSQQDLYKLLFVEKSESEGTVYREVKSNSYGEIQEWPKGFFDQATNDIRELMIEISKRKTNNS
jgi:predicted ATPase